MIRSYNTLMKYGYRNTNGYARLPLLAALLLCAFLFSACGSGEAPSADELAPTAAPIEIAPIEKEETHDTRYKDGVYTAGRKGYGGDILVTATIANDQIIDLHIEGAGETRGVGSVAIERVRTRILEAQSPRVDGVSGATQTSEAVMAAMEDILRKAEY